MVSKQEIKDKDDLEDEDLTLQEERFLNNAGRALRKARLARKISLEDVSNKLRIRKVYLKAIESGDFDALPQLSFSVGFVRSYSILLDLNTDEMVDVFRTDYLKDPTMEKTEISPDDFVQLSSGVKKTNMDYVWGGILACIALVLMWAFFEPQMASDLFDQLFDGNAVQKTSVDLSVSDLDPDTTFNILDVDAESLPTDVYNSVPEEVSYNVESEDMAPDIEIEAINV